MSNNPALQVYVETPPPPLTITLLPLQTVGLLMLAVILGKGFTLIDTAAVVEPQAFEPVTMNVSVAVCVNGAPLVTPLVQV